MNESIPDKYQRLPEGADEQEVIVFLLDFLEYLESKEHVNVAEIMYIFSQLAICYCWAAKQRPLEEKNAKRITNWLKKVWDPYAYQVIEDASVVINNFKIKGVLEILKDSLQNQIEPRTREVIEDCIFEIENDFPDEGVIPPSFDGP